MNSEALKPRRTIHKVIWPVLIWAALIGGMWSLPAHAAGEIGFLSGAAREATGFAVTTDYYRLYVKATGNGSLTALNFNITAIGGTNPTTTVRVCPGQFQSCGDTYIASYTGSSTGPRTFTLNAPVAVTTDSVWTIEFHGNSGTNYHRFKKADLSDSTKVWVDTWYVGLYSTAAGGSYTDYTFSFSGTVEPTNADLTSIYPNTAPRYTPGQEISLVGTNFAAEDVAYFDGTALSTSVASSTEMTAVIPASLLETEGAFDVKVLDSSAAAYTDPVTFTVTSSPVQWNGTPSYLTSHYSLGDYVLSASATLAVPATSDGWIQAVRILDANGDPVSYGWGNHVQLWPGLGPHAATWTIDSATLPEAKLWPGTWRALAVGKDGVGGTYLSTTVDFVVPINPYATVNVTYPGPGAGANWSSTSTPYGEMWRRTDLGSEGSLSGEYVWDATSSQYLSINGGQIKLDSSQCPSGFTMDASGTCSMFVGQAETFINFPLFGWVTGVFDGFQRGLASASSTASRSAKIEIPAMGSGTFVTSAVTIYDSSSSTQGVGAWIKPEYFAWFRLIMVGWLWFGFVMAIFGDLQAVLGLAALTPTPSSPQPAEGPVGLANAAVGQIGRYVAFVALAAILVAAGAYVPPFPPQFGDFIAILVGFTFRLDGIFPVALAWSLYGVRLGVFVALNIWKLVLATRNWVLGWGWMW